MVTLVSPMVDPVGTWGKMDNLLLEILRSIEEVPVYRPKRLRFQVREWVVRQDGLVVLKSSVHPWFLTTSLCKLRRKTDHFL